MKVAVPVIIVVLLVAVGALALGLGDRSASTPAETPAQTPPAPRAGNPASALHDLAAAYRAQREINDVMEITYASAGSETTARYHVRMDGEDRVYLDLPDSDMVLTPEHLYMTLDLTPNKYLEMAAGATPDASFQSITKVPQLHLALRYSDDAKRQLEALTMGFIENARVASSGPVTMEDGTTGSGLVLEGDNGSAHCLVDADTGRLSRIEMNFKTRGGRPVRATAAFAPGPTPAGPIAFDAGDRFRVGSFNDLRSCLPGQPAPDFTLTTLSGETVTLSSLRGSVVVLDFWATWCGPCKRGLPLLNDFNRWVEQQDLPIAVYAVDVWERDNMYPDNEAKRNAVESYWRDAGFTMPTLLDYTGAAAHPFGFSSIPTTIIVAPDGTIAKIHTGYDPDMTDTLKAETQALLQASGA